MLLAAASLDELEIAAQRRDGSVLRYTPIWMVVVGDDTYVRTWHRRETGWFGHATRSHRARIRLASKEFDVVVTDIGAPGTDVPDTAARNRVDDAYQAKYARYGHETLARMVSDDAAATTLRIDLV